MLLWVCSFTTIRRHNFDLLVKLLDRLMLPLQARARFPLEQLVDSNCLFRANLPTYLTWMGQDGALDGA
jgi:hypothetical protein